METPINKKEELKPCPFCGGMPSKNDYGNWHCGSGVKPHCPASLGCVSLDTWNRRVQSNDKSPIQGSSLNTQKSLGVSEPSLVQENVDSRFGAPTTYEQQIASLKAEMQDLKDMGLLISKENVRLQKEVSLSEDRVKKYEEALNEILELVQTIPRPACSIPCQIETLAFYALESQSHNKEQK